MAVWRFSRIAQKIDKYFCKVMNADGRFTNAKHQAFLKFRLHRYSPTSTSAGESSCRRNVLFPIQYFKCSFHNLHFNNLMKI